VRFHRLHDRVRWAEDGGDLMAKLKVEIVESPDDGGFWISVFDADTEKSRASKKIFATEAEAAKALRSNTIKWEPWS
jgi:hypothetical protein